ncbi:hypothetical protein BVC71_10380 [Marivivens niveibacter]|uniref:N-acetyltransferase domain-containing protein n=2 Tax=Marivivens niveibacter TaxID=1930667 RepID=A0A251WXE7_9RHOB|nr:hypothetical protein BVC71_10380 [Marivivens niveibacter]
MFYVREASSSDLPAVVALLKSSYDVQLRDAYPPSVFERLREHVLAVPIELVDSGRFYLAEHDQKILGCGGWMRDVPDQLEPRQHFGLLRMFASSPSALRCGVASEILYQCVASARVEGVKGFECVTTLNAVGFFRNRGFVVEGEMSAFPLAGTSEKIPMVRMQREF